MGKAVRKKEAKIWKWLEERVSFGQFGYKKEAGKLREKRSRSEEAERRLRTILNSVSEARIG